MTTIKRRFAFFLIAVVCISAGYASRTACSAPPAECVQVIANGQSNQFYNAILALRWGPETCCNPFSLRVVNNTGKPIELLWDKTFYLHNGTRVSGLVPAESDCSPATVPQTSSIAPGGSFEAPVWPAILARPSGPPGICSHLPVEMGQNGVFLTIRADDLEMSESVSLDLDYACAFP